MSTSLPRDALFFVTATVAAGAAAVALQLSRAGSLDENGVVWLLAVAIAVACADQFTLTLPHGDDLEHFALTDAIWTFGLVVVPNPALTLGAVAGIVGWQALRRWKPQKIAFNAAQVAVGLTAAQFVYALPASPPEPDEPAGWALVAAAMGAFLLVNTTTVAIVISLAQREPLREVLLDPWRVNVAHMLGNVSIGLLAAVVWQESHIAVLLLGVPLALLYLAYRQWLASVVERDQMEEMTRVAETIARTGRLSSRLPVGEQGSRLPTLALTLNRMLEQIEAAFRRERHFMAEAATELARPVDALVREVSAPTVTGNGASARVVALAARLQRVVEGMAVLARGALPGFVHPQPVQVADFLEEVAAGAPEPLAQRLEVVGGANGIVARFDRQRVAHALGLLLDNAAVHARPVAAVELRAREEDGDIVFEVVDRGGGVPAGHEDAIFEPFYRAGGDRSGPGLGLALVRAVAEAHGGAAGVVNQPGLGVTFWLRVPT